MKVEDSEIRVSTIDDEGEDTDNLYCAIVMCYSGNGWYNNGIVVREATPESAFAHALERAIKADLWK